MIIDDQWLKKTVHNYMVENNKRCQLSISIHKIHQLSFLLNVINPRNNAYTEHMNVAAVILPSHYLTATLAQRRTPTWINQVG